jgi:protein subunit release factor A
METLLLEIRAAEGGEDARSLVYEQLSVYAKASVQEHL